MVTKSISYYVAGKRTTIPLQGLFEARQERSLAPSVAFRRSPQRMGMAIAASLAATPRVMDLFEDPTPSSVLIQPVDPGRTSVIPTSSIVLEGATKTTVRELRRKHGLDLVREGRQRKVMLRVPGSSVQAVIEAARISRQVVESGTAAASYPNFIRVLQRPSPSSTSASTQWNLDNDGSQGLPGADVHALAAWTITSGDSDVRVAVLDEGVDTSHAALRAAVVAATDFVDLNSTAMPSGDDAHGTACAGIICSRDGTVRGLASDVSLIAARIAKSDSHNLWIFDDFDTADAIDWCWDEAKADVLSNSWVGGAPSDAIRLAVERACTKGRGGKGAVVVFAAGNTQQQIGFPANLDSVLTVGASNQWDERKTKASRDGENVWGSNFGPSLDVMAPGVMILTTDISGPAGYDRGEMTATFNGTSAATPHVAATVALMLSVNPRLTEAQARQIVCQTAEPIGRAAVRNDQVGHGRLNAYAAIRAARRG